MALILVVDDDTPVRELTGIILTTAGYQVAEAADGALAIAFLKHQQADLLVLDILMPNVDGWGVLEFVRTMPHPPRVVVATGTHELVPPGSVGQCVSGYLIKPFAVEQLLKTCRTALATETMLPPEGQRKELRRTFLAEAMLLSDTNEPLARGQLVQVSRHGFRVDLAFPFRSGDMVRVGFLIPGRAEPLRLTGRVRWHNEVTVGAEIADIDPGDAKKLEELLGE